MKTELMQLKNRPYPKCNKCNYAFHNVDDKQQVNCPLCAKKIDARNREKYTKKYNETHPEYVIKNLINLKNNFTNEDRIKNYQRTRKYTLQIISKKLIPECVRCGCNDIRLLEINHKLGGGRKEISKNPQQFYSNIYSGKRKIKDLEITCRVCNALHYLEKKFGILPFKIIWNKKASISIMNRKIRIPVPEKRGIV